MEDFGAGLCCGFGLLLPALLLATIALMVSLNGRKRLGEFERQLAEVRAALRTPERLAAVQAAVTPTDSLAASPTAPLPDAAGPAKTPVPSAQTATQSVSAAPVRPRPPLRAPTPPIDIGRLIERAAIWGFAGLGAVLLVVGALFALREVIAHGWLGPVARFAGGIALGGFVWLVAEVLRWRRFNTLASAIAGAGSAILYATLYAGHARWSLTGQGVTFGSMVGVTVIGMFLAERRNSRFAAYMALFGGYATPVLLSTGENKPVAFFAYLALANAGLLYAAWRRRWPDVVGVAGLGTTVLYLGWAISWRAPDQVPVGLAAAGLFTALWLLAARPRGPSLSARFTGIVALAFALLLWFTGTAALGTPADPMRADPRTGFPLTWDLGASAWFAAVWLVASAFVIPLALRASRGARVAAGMVLALGTALLATTWILAGAPRWEVVSGMVPAAAAAALLTGGLEAGLPVLALGGMVVGLVALGQPVPAASLPILTGGLTFAALIGWARSRSRLPLVVLAGVVGLPLSLGLEDRMLNGESLTVCAATLPPYLLAAAAPFLLPRRKDVAGAFAASLIPVALALPLYTLWQFALGTEVDGGLPLLLSANLLVGALVLVRSVRAPPTELSVILLITGTLIGIAAAVPLQLENGWLTVGWSLLLLLLALENRRLPHPLFVGFAAALALAVGARLLTNPYALGYGHADGWPILNWTLYTWGLPTLFLLVAARQFPQRWLAYGLRTIAILTGFALLNLEIAHTFARDGELSFRSELLAQEMVRSVSWSGYGLLLIVIGLVRKSRAVRIAGLGFTVLGVGKMFVADMWSLSGFFRVGAFFGIAVTLLAAAFAFAWLARSDDRRSASTPPPEPTP